MKQLWTQPAGRQGGEGKKSFEWISRENVTRHDFKNSFLGQTKCTCLSHKPIKKKLKKMHLRWTKTSRLRIRLNYSTCTFTAFKEWQKALEASQSTAWNIKVNLAWNRLIVLSNSLKSASWERQTSVVVFHHNSRERLKMHQHSRERGR